MDTLRHIHTCLSTLIGKNLKKRAFIITEGFLLISIITVCFVSHSSEAADTCPNNAVAGDTDMWSTFTEMTQRDYRDMIAAYYNMQKDDWDEGWGWAKYNDAGGDLFEFPKMMSACQLLFVGLDSELRLQGGWLSRARSSGGSSTAPYPQLHAVSREIDSVDLFYRNSDGNLLHALFSDSPWDPGSAPAIMSTNVSNIVATEKEKFRIAGSPMPLNRTTDTVDVFVRDSGHALIHFFWSVSGGWSAENLTSLTVRSVPIGTIYRYFIYADPVPITRDIYTLEVFATDNFNHLIRYYWGMGGSWQAEDITQIVGDQFRIHGQPAVINMGGTIHVFGRDSSKHLIHFSLGSTGWSAEDITGDRGSSYQIDSDPLPISPDGHTLVVYTRSGYKLILYAWDEITGWGWFELDLTDGYALEGDPVGLSRAWHLVNVFVRDINGHIIHYYYSPEAGFKSQDLSGQIGHSFVGNPVVSNYGENRLDLFGRNGANYLVHYYWTNELGWQSENVSFDPGIPLTDAELGDDPLVIQRGGTAIEVFAGRPPHGAWMTHFYSATGLILNPWHTNEEYYRWAAGSLHDFPYVPERDTSANAPRATAYRGIWRDKISMVCPIFDETPASRAGTMLHEATHMIYWDFPHQGNLATSNCSDPCSDNWFFHALRAPQGALTEGQRTHSMNQLQIEYLCDISEFARGSISTNVFNGAQDEADNRMNNRILNPPGWTCGQPRPLF